MSGTLAIWTRALERFSQLNEPFRSPAELAEAARQYFEHATSNHLQEEKLFHYQGDVTVAQANKMRAMSIRGFLVFCGVTRKRWDSYKERDDYTGLCEYIEDVFWTHNFEGAAAGLLNATIVARDLGLADKSEVTGADGESLQTITRVIIDPKAREASDV